MELLRAAEDSAAAVYKQTGAAAPARPLVLASPAGYCRVCHSTSHLSEPVGFEGVDYPHGPHLDAGITCDKCHSLEGHGLTSIKREDCRSCHHGDAKKECRQCHSAQDQLYHGRVADLGISGDPDVMAKADAGCTDCHDLASKEPLVKGVRNACVNCHEKGYDDMAMEWIRDDEKSVQALAVRLVQARVGAASQGRRGGRAGPLGGRSREDLPLHAQGQGRAQHRTVRRHLPAGDEAAGMGAGRLEAVRSGRGGPPSRPEKSLFKIYFSFPEKLLESAFVI